jgi:hypothetical protein
MEYVIPSGYQPAPNLTLYSNGSGTSFAMAQGGLVAPAPGDLAICAAVAFAGTSPATLSPTSGWNNRYSIVYTSGTNYGFIVEDIQTTTPVSPVMTTSSATAQTWAMVASSFSLVSKTLAPPSASTASLWLESDYGLWTGLGTGVEANGNTIEQWNDQSSSANHATNSGTSTTRPTLATGLGPTGAQSVVFNRTNSTFLNNAYTGEIGALFVVYAPFGINQDMSMLAADTSDAVNIAAYNLQSCTSETSYANPAINECWLNPLLWTRATALDSSVSLPQSVQCEVMPVCNFWDLVTVINNPTSPPSAFRLQAQ